MYTASFNVESYTIRTIVSLTIKKKSLFTQVALVLYVCTVCFTICSEEHPLGEIGEILEPSLHDLGFVRLRQCTGLSVYDVSSFK